MTLVLTDLAPGRTATLQLYERGTNTAVGSLIPGTSSGTTYSFAGVPATGDYDAQLAGFSTPNGDRFPVRNAIGYPGVEWSVVDQIDASPSTPTVSDFVAAIDSDFEVDRNLPATVQPSYFVLTDANQKLVATITPTRNGARYTLTIPRAHTTKQRTLYWALRSTADANTIYDSGTIRFDYAATETAPQGPISSTYVPRWGVPAGGSANQILTKVDSVDFNTQWGARITSGTAAPSGGNDGDIYLQHSP